MKKEEYLRRKELLGCKPYPSDLSDEEWEIVEPFIPGKKYDGRDELYPKRDILNAIFYKLKNGCSWRALPHDFPDWNSVYQYFRKWEEAGILRKIRGALVVYERTRQGRNVTPTAAVIDLRHPLIFRKDGEGRSEIIGHRRYDERRHVPARLHRRLSLTSVT